MMQVLRSLPLGLKAFAASTLLLICMAGLGSQAFVFLNALTSNLEALSDSTLAKQAQVLQVGRGAIDTHVDVFRYVAFASSGLNAATLAALHDRIHGEAVEVTKSIVDLAARSDLSARERAAVDNAATKWQRYATAAGDTVEISTNDPALGTVMLGGTDDDYAKVAADIQAISALFTEQTRSDTQDLLQQADLNRRLIAWGGIAAVLLGIGVTLVVARSIVKPIESITRAMWALSAGETNVTLVPGDRDDEIGQMSRAISIFRSKLEYDNRLLAAREKELLLQNMRFDAALNNMVHGVIMFDKDNRLTVANRQYAEMYRLPADVAVPGRTLRELLEARRAAGTFGDDIDKYVASRSVERGKVDRKTTELPDGRTINVIHCRMPDGGWVSMHQDATEQRRGEERIAHMARHDALTGLPNRLLFRERIEQAFTAATPTQRIAVLSVDLDGFKQVNDRLGHPAGDSLLREVADRLRQCVADGDTVARLGGDEFAIIRAAAARPEEVLPLAECIVRSLGAPYDIDCHEIHVGTSVGIAMTPSDGDSAEELLKHADIALYRAKADGRRTYRFFEPAMNAQLLARHALEGALREALSRDQFELHYQPITAIDGSQVVGFEALIRWNHPERGLIPPAEFIPIAEEAGLIHAIGAFVLREACMEAAKWPQHIAMAVNLSAVQLRHKGLLRTIVQALADANLVADRLELEITESVLWQDHEVGLETLHQLRSLGVRIAMDDFGTGYSSLSYLRAFPFDKIKIDRSFVRDIAIRTDCAAIVRAVAGLAGSLGMITTAEGIETEEQFEHVKIAGCTQAQGFYFSRPVPACELARMVSELEDAA